MKAFLDNLICILDHSEFLESGQRFSKLLVGSLKLIINLKGVGSVVLEGRILFHTRRNCQKLQKLSTPFVFFFNPRFFVFVARK